MCVLFEELIWVPQSIIHGGVEGTAVDLATLYWLFVKEEA